MKKIALIIAYNGSLYKGFQRQPHGGAVENHVEEVLLKNNVITGGFSSQQVDYSSSSRTDKGVHAIHQVIAFNTTKEPDEVINIINKELSPEVIAWGYLVDIPWDFNARHWARIRAYIYYVGNKVFHKKNLYACIPSDRRSSISLRQLVYDGEAVLLFRSYGFRRGEIKSIVKCLTKNQGFTPSDLCLVYVGYPFRKIVYTKHLDYFLRENMEVRVFRFLTKNREFLDHIFLYFL